MNLKTLKLFIILFIFFLSGYSFSQEMNPNNHERNFIKDSLEIREMHKDIKDSAVREIVEKTHLERMEMPNYKS